MTQPQPSESGFIKKLSSMSKPSPEILGYGLLIIGGVIVLAMLQYQYWQGEFGHKNLTQLQEQLVKQERRNAEQRNINNILRADVEDLKAGVSAIEEHARLDLGLIKSGETFVQLSVAPVVYSRESSVIRGEVVSEPVDSLVAE